MWYMYTKVSLMCTCVLKFWLLASHSVHPAAVHELLIQSVKMMSNRESEESSENQGDASGEEDEGEIVSDDEEMQVDGSKPALALR